MKTRILVFLLLIILFSCGKKKKNSTTDKHVTVQSNTSQNLNISLLLDLSDRIDPVKNSNQSMQYYQRDAQYIVSVENAFIQHIKNKKIIQLNDQMQVYFDPEPQNPIINKLSQQLRVNFDKNTTKAKIDLVDKTFSTVPLQIYQLAINDKKYSGSDIWKFFKNNVKDYCIKDQHRNILVILTDGYMFHQNSKVTIGTKTSFLIPEYIKAKGLNGSNYEQLIVSKGYGFIPATTQLENLEVLVLGINPVKSNPFEEEVIRKYWEDWFNQMGVKKFYIKNADLPTNLDPIIRKIINTKN